ncbi:hypothetical protein QFZ94_004769 [Paraburkholderia sp. JPY465]
MRHSARHTGRRNAAKRRERPLAGLICTRLVIVPICEVGFLDSYTALVGARVGPPPRGFQAIDIKLAHFVRCETRRVGAMISD